MSSITPKEMSAEDWLKHVCAAYKTLRHHNHSIPDKVLDTMRSRLLGAPALEARIVELDRQVHALLNHCADPECMTCGSIICPHSEPLHFHHDGCPACCVSDAALQGASK